MHNIRAILFDLDGVIIDSEPLHFEAHKKVLEKYKIKLSLEDYMRFGVAKGDNILYEKMSEKFGMPINKSEISQRKKQAYWEILDKKGELMPEILEILQNFSKKYDLAIVSSGVKASVEHVLDKFNVRKYFEVVITGEDVEKIKPFPDVYSKALEKLERSKEECIAIEDSQTGIEAAKNAGLKCIAIPNEFTKNHDFSQADIILSSAKELVDIVNR
ncbi:MAG TPA: HAD family phosphatase [Candidatus Moranbacteria bacterium]|nr:HAD family phosphatase [Candidatus Moranbacteria bacterium]HRZ33789.1 HAD family phosphatase [Candidatus Moranbacteria bacterium]